MMRKIPQQARALRRIESILDAASSVIGEIGFEAATTNLIAERAQTSIGSIYQFFENKEAIISALSDRYLQHLDQVLDDIDARHQVCEGHVWALMEGIAGFYEQSPGFRAFLFGTYSSHEMQVINDHLIDPLLGRLVSCIQRYAPDIDEAEAYLRADLGLYALTRALHKRIHGEKLGVSQLVPHVRYLVVEYMCGAARDAS